MITTAAAAENARDPRAKDAFLIVEPNRKQLIAMAHLLEAGQLWAFVDAVAPRLRAPEAYAGKVRQGEIPRMRGG